MISLAVVKGRGRQSIEAIEGDSIIGKSGRITLALTAEERSGEWGHAQQNEVRLNRRGSDPII